MPFERPKRKTSWRSDPVSLLKLWHLCSLDAPTVAAAWTWYIGHAFNVPLNPVSSVAMFFAVWMLYAADRLLDARTADANPAGLEERHFFHAHHRKAFLAVIALCSILLAVLLPHLSHLELRLFSALGSLVFAYFFIIHVNFSSQQGAPPIRLPKEFFVGLFFSAALFIPTVSRDWSLRYILLVPGAILSETCAINCLLVYEWEHSWTSPEGHRVTRLAVRHKGALGFALLMLCVVTISRSPWAGGSSLVASACALSVLCFLALDAFRYSLSALTKRALVDLALIAPLPLTAWLQAIHR